MVEFIFQSLEFSQKFFAAGALRLQTERSHFDDDHRPQFAEHTSPSA
ncbi:MAG: hypothetical protein ABI972_13565 [Acidobacteriota bacterium]